MSTATFAAAEALEEWESVRDNGLDDDFWDGRPYLKHIRAAAHSRQRSAPAVLGVALARAAAMVSHNLRIPPIVGADAGLSLITVVLAPPGVGKSTASQLAGVILPPPFMSTIADNLPIGTGEGMVEAFFGMVEEEDDKGKPQKVKKQVRHNAYFFVDEGQVLGEIGSRKGATLLPTIRSVFTGSTIGQMNASEERRRILTSGSYSMGIVIALQTVLAGALLDDAEGGTPQRCLWMPAIDPTIPDDPPPWPGVLDWQPPSHDEVRSLRRDAYAAGARQGDNVDLVVADSVAREIRQADLGRARGEIVTEVLDAHEGLLRLKVAALLAVLDGRLDIGEEDWQLAAVIKAASDRTRTSVVEAVKHKAGDEEAKYSAKLARREVDKDVAVTRRRMVDGARWIARKVWTADPQPCSVAQLRRDIAKGKREAFTEALDHAAAEGWVVEVTEAAGHGIDKRLLKIGERRP